MRARAVHFTAPRTVELREVVVPDPGAGDLVVRTLYSGISGGTEMLAYRGEIDPTLPLDETLGALSGTFEYPFSYGYSAVGTVERAADAHREGETVFAFHPHQDVFVVGAADALRLPDVEPRTAALLPLVETALQITLDAGARLGEVVVVIGLGAVGILTATLLARAGARVIGAEPAAWRRTAAEHFGVTATTPDELSDSVARLTDGRGASLVVEASGNPGALAGALSLLAHEGVALVASWYGTKPVALPLGAEFHRRRLQIRSTQVSTIPSELAARWDRPRRRTAAIELLRDLPVGELATHEFAFDEPQRAYEAIDRGEEGLIHAALRYP